MSNKAKLTLTIDAGMKKEFAQFCKDIGFPMSLVASGLIGQVIRKQELKISSLDINGFTPKEAAELKRRVEELKAMRNKKYAEEWN